MAYGTLSKKGSSWAEHLARDLLKLGERPAVGEGVQGAPFLVERPAQRLDVAGHRWSSENALSGRHLPRSEHRLHIVERLPLAEGERLQLEALDVMVEILQEPRGILGRPSADGIQIGGDRRFE